MKFINQSVFLRRLFYRSTHSYGTSIAVRVLIIAVILLLAILILVLPLGTFLNEVSGQAAQASATDAITAIINESIAEKMADGQYTYEYFVSMQKDETGNITAVSANMSRINLLSAEIIKDIIARSENGKLNLKIPIGSLLDSSLLIGRGPNVPIKVVMLTSSSADFHNEFISVGINQSKHQIMLDITVEVNLLLPWEILPTKVTTQVLIAETIIVGKVPDTYLDLNP